MIVMPAIDLRDGACVQLVGGSYDDERVRLEDPVAVARRWARVGFRHLHVVDLDAALERGSNAEVIDRILAVPGLEVQVGGGVRSGGAIARLLNAGARRVVLGTRAIEEPEWLEATARAFPNTIVVAVDARGHHVVTRGWTRALETDVRDRAVELSRLPLAGVLVTAVHCEGRMEGVDLELARSVIERAEMPVQVAGGVGALEDLRALESAGAAATIAGMALYTGRLDPHALVAEFGGAAMTVLERATRETRVRVVLSRGAGEARADTGVAFLDHMLAAFARYAGLDLEVQARGDLRHHLIEDVAIVVGQALQEIVPATAARYGDRTVPMDDALVQVAIDLGGRGYYRGPLPSGYYDHWMRSFAENARATLHVRVLRGEDRHHVVEAAFKALGFAVRQALEETGAVFSTKGAVSMTHPGNGAPELQPEETNRP